MLVARQTQHASSPARCLRRCFLDHQPDSTPRESARLSNRGPDHVRVAHAGCHSKASPRRKPLPHPHCTSAFPRDPPAKGHLPKFVGTALHTAPRWYTCVRAGGTGRFRRTGRSDILDRAPICRFCRQIVELRSGIIVPHWREPHSHSLCPATYRSYAYVRWLRGAELARYQLELAAKAKRRQKLRAAYDTIPRNVNSHDDDPVPAPELLPMHEGRHYVAVMLPGSGPADVWLPGKSRGEQQRFIGRFLPSTHGLKWNEWRGCWSVPTRHFLELARHLLRYNKVIMLGREFNPLERCNGACRHAAGPNCQCSCRAKYHGRGKWKAGWIEVNQFDTRHRGAAWHWTLFTRDAIRR